MYEKIHTFFLPSHQWSEPWSLAGKEAHHLTKVLRIAPGHKIRLIDGSGKTGIFTVQNISKNEVSLLCNETYTWPEPQNKVHLALAWNKSFRRSWLLEKAVELGAWKIILWQAKHSQGKTKDASQDNWQGKMIAAAKQCENPWLPELIFLHEGAGELIRYSRDIQSKLLLWEEEKNNRIMEHFQNNQPREKVVVIGPEGGLDREEVDIFVDSGFVPLSLGPRVLRWETAALAPLFLDMLFFQ
ncbi:MAG: 16S rRNA (uracil(1498)-N(3))-methyltransferase [Desulfonatronovibrio sp.]